jgi:hypothetical protein
MTGMEMKPVKSSNVKEYGYDPATRKLRIAFLSGGVYDHSDVSPSEHEAFAAAESKGGHYHKHIRGKFAHSKVDA